MLVVKKLLAKILGALDYWRTPYGFTTIPSKSVPSGTTIRNFGSFTLPHKGWYLVKVIGAYSTNGTGYRTLFVAASATGSYVALPMADVRPAIPNSNTWVQTVFIVEATTDNYVRYVNGFQTSGASLTFDARVQYIRLR